MPLIQGKSKKSFDKNLKTEISHGKPLDQALAISYDIKRRNAKKMAEGGKVETDSHSYELTSIPGHAAAGYRIIKKNKKTGDQETFEIKGSEERAKQALTEMVPGHKDKKYAQGGSVGLDHPMEAHKSMFEILMERRRQRMAEGGEVDLKLNSMEQPNEYYHLNEDEVLEENYGSEYEDLDQPEDSNLKADSDEKPSIIHQIRQKRLMRSK